MQVSPIGDFGSTPDQLEAKYRTEHPSHTREDWALEVQNHDTKLGYWEWVMHQVEMRFYDDCDQCGANETDKVFVLNVGFVCTKCAAHGVVTQA